MARENNIGGRGERRGGGGPRVFVVDREMECERYKDTPGRLRAPKG